MSSGNRHSRSYLKRNRTIIKNIREKQGAAASQWNHAGFLKQFFSFSAQAFNGKHCQKRSALQARYTVISGFGAKKGFFPDLWAAGLANYDEAQGINRTWLSADGCMTKVPLTQKTSRQAVPKVKK
jgi:hypothetical protein